MNSREQFEQTYAEAHQMPMETFSQYRMGDSYREPLIAKCWRFWKASRESIEIEIPEPEPFNVSADESLDMEPDEYDYLEARHGAQYSTYRKICESIKSQGFQVKS